MSKHRVVCLPLDALEANLDNLSAQGWEFVAWVDPNATGIYVEQRRALLRRAEAVEKPASDPAYRLIESTPPTGPLKHSVLGPWGERQAWSGGDIRDQATAGYDPNPLNT